MTPSTESTVASQSAPSTAAGIGSLERGKWARWLWPSLFDLIFASLPLWFFGLADGGTGLLLSDGDTGWHIRTGEWILQHRSFVRGDIFSFTKPGEPWFAWEWLSDIVLAVLHNLNGMPCILMLGIVLAALFFGITFRHMVWRGANVFVALPLALMGFGSATVHLLARPHLFTMLFVVVSGWLIQADLRRPSKWVWLLVPLTAVWTNLHGGWLALIAILGLTSVGCAIEIRFGASTWAAARRYAALAAACLAASLLNPYGWHLHAHMGQYLTADWIKDMVGEFRSPTFRSENMLQYEALLLLSCAASGSAMLRGRFVGPLLTAFWAHSSLVSARHIPLFVAVALPFLADELQAVWNSWTDGARKSSTAGILQGLAMEAQTGIARISVWAVIPFVLIAMQVIPIPWRTDFPSERFPVKMVARNEALLVNSRVYTEDQWADYLIYRFAPRMKVFFDGRSDFYGETITREYRRLMGAEHDWRALLDKYAFDVALVKPTWALATVLKESGEWQVVEDDGKSILMRRIKRPALQQSAEIKPSGANEKP